MSNKDTKNTKNFERVIREDTRIALQKVNEMKSSWDKLIGSIPELVTKGVKKYSEYSKKAVAQATGSNDLAKRVDDFKDIPRTTTRTPGSPEPAPQPGSPEAKDKAKPDVGEPSSDLPDTRDPRGDAAPNMPKAKEIAAKTGSTRNYLSGKAVEGGAKYEPEAPKTPEAPKASTPAAGTGKTAQTFKQAFAAARKEAGSSKGQFEYGGKKYQTNFQGTGTKEKPQEKYISAGKQKVTSVKSDAAPATPKPAETPKAPETQNTPAPKTEPEIKADVSTAPATPTSTPSATTPKGADGADGASVGGGKGGKGGKGGETLGECVQIGANKYRII